MADKKRQITSIIRYAIGFTIMSIFSAFYLPLMCLFLPSRYIRIRMGNLYGKIVGPMVLRSIGMKALVKNRERINANYPAIYLSNHTSQLDPLIAIWICPFGGCGIAKKEIASIPFFGWTYRLAGHLLIDRSSPERAIASMKELSHLVDKLNLGVWIWPEGTRSLDGRLLPLKKGFVHMAIETGLPIVPIVVRDAHLRWPSKTKLLYPGDYEIEVLEKVETKDWTKESIDQHIAQIYQIYCQNLSEDQLPLLTE
jgi:1-acyl-sn-glycerol-3-phosphate acyltransferase